MQQGDYSSYYNQYSHQLQNPTPNVSPNPTANPTPNPAPADLQQISFASAPPYIGAYGSSDYLAYSQNYSPYSANPVSAPPSAPSVNPPPQQTAPTSAVNPNHHSSFNQPPSATSYTPYDSHGTYQQSTFAATYDQNHLAPSCASRPSSIPTNHNPSSPFTSSYSAYPYNQSGSSVPPASDDAYDNSMKFMHGDVYYDQKYRAYDRSRSDLGSDVYGKRSDVGGYSRYDDLYGDGVYAYEGAKSEPYGARGTAPRSSSSTLFDDYGRPINLSSSDINSPVSSGSVKVVRAVPKPDEQVDVKGSVQKFRVKLLAESGGQSTMDVLCQVGLDGIRMLDTSTSRTLRIYPLENITRCEVYDSSTLSFWSKSAVDIEPRRIRLQSNRYTTDTLLDTITAATVQFKEMGGSRRPSEPIKNTEQPTEKKKGFTDLMNLIKPINEEKDHWVPDEAVSKCTGCGADFSAFNRKHHCRNCGDIFCDKCTQGRMPLTAEENAPQVRVCDRCLAEVTQRLNNAKEAARRPAVRLQSHEDLARKLQEEMERNRRASSGSRTEGSGRRMKEVACPTCTVHLQVQVPLSGSETIECGVCQNPFLVNAR